MRSANTRISLGIRLVWSESSLCAPWVAKDPSLLHTDSKDSDQTGRIPRLIWVLAGCIVILLVCHKADHICFGLIWKELAESLIHPPRKDFCFSCCIRHLSSWCPWWPWHCFEGCTAAEAAWWGYFALFEQSVISFHLVDCLCRCHRLFCPKPWVLAKWKFNHLCLTKKFNADSWE